jgi:hypothetical protein
MDFKKQNKFYKEGLSLQWISFENFIFVVISFDIMAFVQASF